MPVALNQIPANKRLAALKRAATMQLHAMGMVVREVPQHIMRIISRRHTGGAPPTWNQMINQAPAGTRRNAVRRAQEVDRVLQRLCDGQHPICNPSSVTPVFARMVLEGRYRTDTTVLLAMRMDSSRIFQFRPTAVVAWAQADRDDTDEETGEEIERLFGSTDPESVLNKDVAGKRVAEVDLVCSAFDPLTAGYDSDDEEDDGNREYWQTKGAARTLLVYALLRIAERKKAGDRRFNAVIAHMAHTDSHPNPDLRNYPVRRTLQALGFVPLNTWEVNNEQTTPSDRRYMILRDQGNTKWEQRLAQAIVRDGPAAALCPLQPSTGLSYCV